jgi:cysteinyl-tRNA synthetase
MGEKRPMGLDIYNTLSKKKEPFVPLREGKARRYVCSAAIYDSSRFARARSFPSFDLPFRSSSGLNNRADISGGTIWQKN